MVDHVALTGCSVEEVDAADVLEVAVGKQLVLLLLILLLLCVGREALQLLLLNEDIIIVGAGCTG